MPGVGPLQAAPFTGPSVLPVDVLASLLEFRFGTPYVGFPVIQTSLTLRQDLTIHKFADRDGAHVEAMGRHPIQITARIPFINGLVPGAQETWDPQNLFPGAWSAFMTLALQRQSQTLVHPSLGPLTCKLEHFKTDWDGKTRGGVWVDVTWVESDDTATELVNSISSQSPSSAATSAAADLDANLQQLATDYPDLEPVLGTLDPPEVVGETGTFTSLTNGALKFTTTVNQYQWEKVGALNSVIYQATAVENAVINLQNPAQTTAVTASSIRQQPQCLLWPLIQSGEQVKDAAYTLLAQQLNRQPSILVYTTTKDCTIAQIANILQADVIDILQLNVGLSTLNFVPVGSQVKYYSQTS